MTLVIVRDLLAEHVHEYRPLRTRPDEAHVTADHIDKLGQLVQAVPSQETTDARHARIVLLSPLRLVVLLGIRSHRTKLQYLEMPAAITHALLPVQDRTLGIELDRQRNQKHDGRRDRQPQYSKHNIQRPLETQRNSGPVETLAEHKPAWPDGLQPNPAAQLGNRRMGVLYFDSLHAQAHQLL